MQHATTIAPLPWDDILSVEKIDAALAMSGLDKGLRQYLAIQNYVSSATNSLLDNRPFQKQFNLVYSVRRGSEWQRIFYDLMDRYRAQPVDFSSIINDLHQATGRCEASFASKLVATLDPTQPVIDSVVLKTWDWA